MSISIVGIIILPERTHGVNFEPRFDFWHASHLKNEVQLVLLVRTLEKSRTTKHLRYDTADAPHIDFGRVLNAVQQQLGQAIPEGNDLVGDAPHLLRPAVGQTHT